MSLGRSSSSQQQSSDPWEAQQPYLKDLYEKAQGWYNQQTPLEGSADVERTLFDRASANLGGSDVEQALLVVPALGLLVEILEVRLLCLPWIA